MITAACLGHKRIFLHPQHRPGSCHCGQTEWIFQCAGQIYNFLLPSQWIFMPSRRQGRFFPPSTMRLCIAKPTLRGSMEKKLLLLRTRHTALQWAERERALTIQIYKYECRCFQRALLSRREILCWRHTKENWCPCWAGRTLRLIIDKSAHIT